MVAVQDELCGSGSNVGYRRMWTALKKKSLIVRREDVRISLSFLDPEGVERRRKHRLRRRKYRNPGPNKVWHIDGHDKLKPYGFSVHGCIDGFSRRIIWLDVSSSNKRPELVARHYLDAIKYLNGIPDRLVADDGTEHALVEPIHLHLRNEINTFSIVTSPRNQRIESYWSKLRNDRLGWWKIFLQDLVDLNLYDTTDGVQIDIARFCFMRLIRSELKQVAEDWNQHIISKSINGGPRGRPDTMYFLPHLYGTQDFLIGIENGEADEFNVAVEDLPRDFSEEIEEFSGILMEENNIDEPSNPTKALELFLFLRDKALQL